MKKLAGLFVKGILLGLFAGLCLAGGVGLLYNLKHGPSPHGPFSGAHLYLYVVGTVMGIIAGWCLALQMVLADLLTVLFLKVFELVPPPVAQVGKDWSKKMETFFHEVLQPMPYFLRRFVEFFLVARFEDCGRINRALDKAKKKEPSEKFTPQWMCLVILHYFLEPLWVVFYVVYAILFVLSSILWSFPFF